MKIITICGSLRFQEIIMHITEKFELEGNCVLSIIYPTKPKDDYTNEEIQILEKGHFKKIELSDAIFVVNKNKYVGEGAKNEIKYAKGLKKEIMYMENPVEV
jgi:hypothetical protein